MPHSLRSLILAAGCLLAAALDPANAAPGHPVAAGSLKAPFIQYQFAIYYADAPTQAPAQALARRLQSDPQAPAQVDTIPEQPGRAVVRSRWVTDALSSYSPPSLEELKRFGHGITAKQAQQVQRANRVLLLHFAHPAADSMMAYRSSLALVEHVARDTGGMPWDEETRELFTPDEWQARRLQSWEGDLPNLVKHIVIHAYKDDKLFRANTIGMLKFGLPDIVVDDFAGSENSSMPSAVNVLAQTMAEGLALTRAGEHVLSLSGIRHSQARAQALGDQKSNAQGQAKLRLVQGTPVRGDPDNRLVEIRFDRYPGPDLHARQHALLTALFGTEDALVPEAHTSEVRAASEAARAKLPTLRERFNRGMQAGESLLVKVPFDIPEGGREWMWVEVIAWQGDAMTGLLKNEPFKVPTLRAGQRVTVSEARVFDYIHRDEAGREDGNTTGKIMAKAQGARR